MDSDIFTGFNTTSDGFFAFSEIIRYAPAFCAPVMRPSPQRATARRFERCRRFAASIAEMYFMPYIVYISSMTILYSQLGTMSRRSNGFTVFYMLFFVFKAQGRRSPPPLHPYGCLYSGFISASFFSVTALPITVPPLMHSNAIHNMRWLWSPV